MTPVELATPPINTKRMSGPAIRAFLKIAGLWKLTVPEQMTLLGVRTRSTYFNWKRAKELDLPKDTLERISYLLGIFKSLQILLSDQEAADTWVRQPNDNPLFAGKPALERMLSGNVADLFIVRQYLDAERGGWA